MFVRFRIIAYLVILSALLLVGISNYSTVKAAVYSSDCEKPITYRIDGVDRRFNLTEAALKADLQLAEAIWERDTTYNLFEYDPQGKIGVSLVYDERQGLNNQINDLEKQLQNGQKSLQEQQAEYDRLDLSFRKRLADFNDRVNFYNSQGGAPLEEYDKLIAEQESLKKEADRLNQFARQLNRTVNSYNQQVGTLNKTVDQFSEALERRPEEGIYLPAENRIEIYFNNDKEELVHTLAHELGHSRGLDHNDDESSIMLPFTTDDLTISDFDKRALEIACRKKTIFDRLSTNVGYLVRTYLQKESEN